MKPPRYLVYAVFVFLVVSIGLMFSRVPALISLYRSVASVEKVGKIPDNSENPTKHVCVNNTDYDIDRKYFMMGVPYAILDVDIYLVTLYPDFKPLTVDVNNLSRMGLHLSQVSILAHDPVGRLDLRGIAKGVEDRTHKAVPGPYKYGLQMYDKASDEAWANGDLYIRQENGKVTMVIMCHGDLLLEGETPNKQPHMCESYFEDSFLQYKVSFFDTLLPKWSEIETKTRVLFKRFRDSALEKSLNKAIIPEDRISPHLFNKRQGSQ